MPHSGRDPRGEQGSLAIFYLLLGLTLAGILIVAAYIWG